MLGQLPQTRAAFALAGYVPAKVAGCLAAELTERFAASVDVERIPEEEQPPVLLHNNTFARSGEGVLASFGLPKKDELDPTGIMTVFYVFLFGLMLSDAAYGAIISIACGAAILKFPRMEESLKKSLQLFFWCGLSTLFWGIMFGGYFGDALDVIAKTFFGVSLPEGTERDSGAVVRSAERSDAAFDVLASVRLYSSVYRAWHQGISLHHKQRLHGVSL